MDIVDWNSDVMKEWYDRRIVGKKASLDIKEKGKEGVTEAIGTEIVGRQKAQYCQMSRKFNTASWSLKLPQTPATLQNNFLQKKIMLDEYP